jgi:hypothetical protein
MDILESLKHDMTQELSSSSYDGTGTSIDSSMEIRPLPRCISRNYTKTTTETPYSSPQKSALKLSDILLQNKISPPSFDSFQVTSVPQHIQKCINSKWLQNAENQVIHNGKAEMEEDDDDDDSYGEEPDFADEFFRTTLSTSSRKRKRNNSKQEQSVSENSSRLQAIIDAAEQRQQERIQRKQTNSNKTISVSSIDS